MAFFRFPNHVLKLKALDQPHVKAFWQITYYIVVYATLCVSFSVKSKGANVFQKYILKSEARDKSIQAKKEPYCHVTVKNHLCNVLWTFLIKIESTWMREIKEQAPQLILL